MSLRSDIMCIIGYSSTWRISGMRPPHRGRIPLGNSEEISECDLTAAVGKSTVDTLQESERSLSKRVHSLRASPVTPAPDFVGLS